jgi:protoheme IX farnesyltransferase
MRDVASLFKLRISILIMITALAGVAAAPGPSPGALRVLTLAFAVLLASASAGAFNQYFEFESDALMTRTRGRAFVTGALKPSRGWLILIGAMLAVAVALAAFVVNPASACYVFLGAFFYAVVYTVWLKRRTWLNIVIGGLAGSFAVLAGAAAVDPAVGAQPALLALILFLWTPPHFWSLAMYYRQDYAAAGIPMLPVVHGDVAAARAVFAHTIVLVLLSLAPVAWGLGWIYAAGALGGGSYFVHRAWCLLREQTPRNAIRCFLASLLQLGVLLAATLLDGALAGALVRL